MYFYERLDSWINFVIYTVNTRGVNKGRLPAFAGGNVLLAGGKISDRPVEISILANILLRLQFHLIYLAKKGEVTSLNSCLILPPGEASSSRFEQRRNETHDEHTYLNSMSTKQVSTSIESLIVVIIHSLYNLVTVL